MIGGHYRGQTHTGSVDKSNILLMHILYTVLHCMQYIIYIYIFCIHYLFIFTHFLQTVTLLHCLLYFNGL